MGFYFKFKYFNYKKEVKVNTLSYKTISANKETVKKEVIVV
jgi:hypothetical protein